jgi:uncharacterized coiled-coil DUF342 family protein
MDRKDEIKERIQTLRRNNELYGNAIDENKDRIAALESELAALDTVTFSVTMTRRQLHRVTQWYRLSVEKNSTDYGHNAVIDAAKLAAKSP